MTPLRVPGGDRGMQRISDNELPFELFHHPCDFASSSIFDRQALDQLPDASAQH